MQPLLDPRNDSLDFHALLAVLYAAEIQMIDGVCTMEALAAGKCTLEKGFQICEPQQELTESVKPFLSDLYLVSDKLSFYLLFDYNSFSFG